MAVQKINPNESRNLNGIKTSVLLFTKMSDDAETIKLREMFIEASNKYTEIDFFEMDLDEHPKVAASLAAPYLFMDDRAVYLVKEKGMMVYWHPHPLSYDGLNSLLCLLQSRQSNGMTGDLILGDEIKTFGSTEVIRKITDVNLPYFLRRRPLSVILFTKSNPDENMLRMEAIFENAASQFEEIQFGTVEVDVMQSVASKFQIERLPTCIGIRSTYLPGISSEEQFHKQLFTFLGDSKI